MKRKCIVFLLSLLWTNVLLAQNYFGLLNEGRQIASLGVHANPNLNANADYLFSFEEQSKSIERYGIVAQANFPIFSQKGFDFDFRIGAGALVAFSEKFKAIGGLSWNFSRTENINGRYFHSGFSIDLFPGHYGSKWVFAPHIAFHYQPWVHIKHSTYVLNAFQDLYPNNGQLGTAPKDGWFYQNNTALQMGIGIAYVQPQWHLNLTAGFQYQPNTLGLVVFPDVGLLPFYGALNFGYRIKEN